MSKMIYLWSGFVILTLTSPAQAEWSAKEEEAIIMSVLGVSPTVVEQASRQMESYKNIWKKFKALKQDFTKSAQDTEAWTLVKEMIDLDPELERLSKQMHVIKEIIKMIQSAPQTYEVQKELPPLLNKPCQNWKKLKEMKGKTKESGILIDELEKAGIERYCRTSFQGNKENQSHPTNQKGDNNV